MQTPAVTVRSGGRRMSMDDGDTARSDDAESLITQRRHSLCYGKKHHQSLHGFTLPVYVSFRPCAHLGSQTGSGFTSTCASMVITRPIRAFPTDNALVQGLRTTALGPAACPCTSSFTGTRGTCPHAHPCTRPCTPSSTPRQQS